MLKLGYLSFHVASLVTVRTGKQIKAPEKVGQSFASKRNQLIGFQRARVGTDNEKFKWDWMYTLALKMRKDAKAQKSQEKNKHF